MEFIPFYYESEKISSITLIPKRVASKAMHEITSRIRIRNISFKYFNFVVRIRTKNGLRKSLNDDGRSSTSTVADRGTSDTRIVSLQHIVQSACTNISIRVSGWVRWKIVRVCTHP
jgi:hypothetical protein